MPVVGHLKRTPNAVVAAASQRRISPTSPPPRPEASDAAYLYGLYRRLGQVRYGLQFKANAATKIRYYVARSVPGEEREQVEDGPAAEYLDRLQGSQGGFPQIVSKAMLDLDIAGEAYLVGKETDEDQDWAMWSAVEYQDATPGSIKRKVDAVDPLTEDDFVLRVWRPDPEKRELPDAPLRSVREEAEQYILLRDAVSATAKSRLPAGWLLIPDEITLPSNNPNDLPGADSFLDYLIDIVTTAVNSGDSAARIAPAILRGAGDRLPQIRYLTDERELDELYPALMERVLRQMAIGLDLPAEILLGLADVNHWGQWLIDDSARLNHADPLILLILDSITRGYLRPHLMLPTSEGGAGMTREQAEEYEIWRDFTDLTSRTVTAQDARSAFVDGIITAEAYRGVLGFTEDDGPVEIEGESPSVVDSSDLAARVNAAGILIRSGFTPEASLQAMGLPAIEHTGLLPVTVKEEPQVEPGEGDLDTTPVRAPAPVEEPTGEDVRRGPPAMAASAAPRSLDQLTRIDRRLYTQIAEASQAALDRALEKAGARIRSHVSGDQRKYGTLAAQIDGTPNHRVALTLGREAVERLQLTDGDLIPEGTFSSLGDRVLRLLRRGQDETASTVAAITGEDLPRDPTAERSWRERAVEFLTAALGAVALSRLFTPDMTPDPAQTGEVNDVQVPAGDVWDALTLASGGTPGPADVSPRGLANGQQTVDWLQTSGFRITERRWDHGDPAIPFEPHKNLDGTVFGSWTDTVLSTPGYASWLQTPYMFPGDHRGCTCSATLLVE